jgi:hypothetical protein
MSKRWIKVPGPGDFRGEGEWKTIEEAGCPLADWEWNRETAYLPTHEGDTPPSE